MIIDRQLSIYESCIPDLKWRYTQYGKPEYDRHLDESERYRRQRHGGPLDRFGLPKSKILEFAERVLGDSIEIIHNLCNKA